MNEYNQFTDEHKVFFMKFMEWYWKSRQNTNTNFILKFQVEVTISDYEFIYSLWKNGVNSYNDKMQNRLNKLRNIYIENT
jgi:hypothetical protein|tara:strand:- start:400 stop:639 length:240 start_codon:yes stop_codon:yes gene_type:complete